MSFLSAISSILNPPPKDPKRFSGSVEYIPNWHGELIGKRGKGNINDRVQYDPATGVATFHDNSAFSGIDIPATLTAKDIEGLKYKRLDPSNIWYSKAKAYFAANPTCNKQDLAQASGMAVETAKDVIAIFRNNIPSPSPTAENTRFYGGDAGEGEGEG